MTCDHLSGYFRPAVSSATPWPYFHAFLAALWTLVSFLIKVNLGWSLIFRHYHACKRLMCLYWRLIVVFYPIRDLNLPCLYFTLRSLAYRGPMEPVRFVHITYTQPWNYWCLLKNFWRCLNRPCRSNRLLLLMQYLFEFCDLLL